MQRFTACFSLCSQMEAFPAEHNYRNIMSIQQGGLNPQQRPTIEELKVNG